MQLAQQILETQEGQPFSNPLQGITHALRHKHTSLLLFLIASTWRNFLIQIHLRKNVSLHGSTN